MVALNDKSEKMAERKVPIPVIAGKITKAKRKAGVYVLYELERVYDAKKSYNVPKRVTIGKVCPGDDKMMVPNENYQKYFPTAAIPEEHAEVDRSCCLKIGPHLVFDKILEEHRLKPMLSKHFGENTGLLLDLVSYLIVNEDNAGQYYPDFAFSHLLFTKNQKIKSDSTVSRFFSSVTKDQIFGFLDDWNAQRDHRNRIYVSYDSTNKNLQAGDIDYAEFGNAKVDKGVPVINVAVAFDKTNREPLFYEEYPGSINDVSQLRFLIDKIKAYGYKDLGLILDRGYFSRDNIEYLDACGYSFIMMVKGCKALVDTVIEEKRHTFESTRKSKIGPTGVYGVTVEKHLFSGDKHKRYFHLYFSPSKMAAERDRVEKKIAGMAATLKSLEGQKVELPKEYLNYFHCHFMKGKTKDEAKTFLYAEEKESVVQRELDLCGYFAIITSETMSAEQAYILYKGRDASEKLFGADKTFLGSRSMRVQSNEAVSAKFFIEFIALIIRNRFYILLKEEMLRTEKRKNFLTVPAALPSLSKYFLIANQEGTEKINGHPDFDYNEDSVKVLKSPKGTTFVIPNTGGTKAYDAIYGYSLEHIKAVRPKLSWLTQAQLEHDDYLFEKGWQPHRSERFKTKHENWRDSSKQKFVVYRITGDRPTGEVYQVSGDLIKGEQRRVTIVDRFEIRK